MHVEPGCNLKNPILQVEHFQLAPADKRPNRWMSECPACKEGVLCVIRNPETHVIAEYDNCRLCGQSVQYTDVEEMRRKDGAT